MSEFKFSCPSCQQHISCDDYYSGKTIPCPACQNLLVVPQFATVAPPPLPVQAVNRPEPATRSAAAPLRPEMRPHAGTSSKLAVASLALSLGSLLIGPFGFIPGIICGHLAKARMRRDPSLKGFGLAKSGLIVGYCFLSLSILIFGGVVFYVASASKQLAMIAETNGLSRIAVRPASAEPTSSNPALPELAAPASGHIGAQDFRFHHAKLLGEILKLFNEPEDLEISINMGLGPPLTPGRKISVTHKKDEMPGLNEPHLWSVSHRPSNAPGGDAAAIPKGGSYFSSFDAYEMQLEFGEKAGGILPGKIHLEIPSKQVSVTGSFQIAASSSSRPAPMSNAAK